MVRFIIPSTFALLTVGALGASVPDGTWPESQGNVSYTEPYVVAAGEIFDGGMKTYDRSDITCEGQTESGSSTAVFKVEAGGTLKNVIIGTNQMEGVHCDDHDCTIENVWWEDVCEDALSIKGGDADSVSTVTGGGARYADDKVIQHNGYGSVVIDGFYAEDFGKLYRSCGTCGDRQRFVNVSNVYAVDPDVSIVTVNENYGDEAILKNIYISADDDDYVICGWSEGTDGDEPTSLGDGISYPLCQYSDSDIHINEAVPSSSSSDSTVVSTSSASNVAASSTGSTSAAVASDAASTTSSSATSNEASSDNEASSNYVTSSDDNSEGSSTEASAAASETGSEVSSEVASLSASAVDDDAESSSIESDEAATSSASASASTSSSTYDTESASTDSSSTAEASTASDTSAFDSESSSTESTESSSASIAGEADSGTSTSTSTSATSKCSVRRH